MNRTKAVLLVLVGIMALVSTACSGATPTSTPRPTRTPTPIRTPLPTSTPTPIATPTSLPGTAPVLIPDGSAAAPGLAFATASKTGFYLRADGQGIGVTIDGHDSAQLMNTGIFTDGVFLDRENKDVALVHEAETGVAALRNGQVKQGLRIYEKYIDANNYSRLNFFFDKDGDLHALREAAGTARPVPGQGSFDIGTRTEGPLVFWTANQQRWYVDYVTGSLLAWTDAEHDIGREGNRPRDITAAGRISGAYLQMSSGKEGEVGDNGQAGVPSVSSYAPEASYVSLSCQDPDGCVVELGGRLAKGGDLVTIVVTGERPVTIRDEAGVAELAGDFEGKGYDTLVLLYAGDRWVELSRSRNSQ